MFEELQHSLAKASGLSLEEVQKNLSRPKERQHGDLTFQCFALAKIWKLNPAECAKKLAVEVKLPAGIESATPTGPYLNLRYERLGFTRCMLAEILRKKEQVGSAPNNGKVILVDYSHPNIAKTFHVGHLRTTLIGHSIVQIFRHLGYTMNGINHLGDWGTQFGFVWAGCELWGKPAHPTVEALVDLYRRATALRKLQEEGKVSAEDSSKPDVNQMARDYFIRLENKDSDARAFWQWCLDISLDYFKAMYDRLGITFEYYTGESFYEKMIPGVEKSIRESNILEDSEGALGVNCGKKLGFARIFTEDGRSLYITRDIAAADYRESTFRPDRILYVVAAQQTLHFQQLKEILRRMKRPVAEKIVHIPFGFVPGMKTREAGGISLKEFLDEAFQNALNAYRTEVQRRPQGSDEVKIAETVAIGATYFYFLSHTNNKDFNFSWDMALNFSGASGPYLQYAYARIFSVEAKANEAGISVDTEFEASLIREDSAYDLVMLLSDFGEVVSKAAAEYEPYYIAFYLLDVAKAFSKAYLELKVIDAERETAKARLALFRATKFVLGTGLRLLGVPCIERM